jgi:hypothetical protein
MVGIAQLIKQRAVDLMAQVRLSGISSFPLVLFSYLLLTFLCINVFAFCTFCILYYLCITVYVTLPPGIGPIAVSNKSVYI